MIHYSVCLTELNWKDDFVELVIKRDSPLMRALKGYNIRKAYTKKKTRLLIILSLKKDANVCDVQEGK